MKSSTSSHPVAALLTLALAAPLAACGSSGTPTGTGAVGNVVIKDANNYTSTSSLTIPVVETKAGADLSISWNGITQDLLCHPAGSIDNVAFLRIGNMTQAQVEDKLAKGQLTSNAGHHLPGVPHRGRHVDDAVRPCRSDNRSSFRRPTTWSPLAPST